MDLPPTLHELLLTLKEAGVEVFQVENLVIKFPGPASEADEPVIRGYTPTVAENVVGEDEIEERGGYQRLFRNQLPRFPGRKDG